MVSTNSNTRPLMFRPIRATKQAHAINSGQNCFNFAQPIANPVEQPAPLAIVRYTNAYPTIVNTSTGSADDGRAPVEDRFMTRALTALKLAWKSGLIAGSLCLPFAHAANPDSVESFAAEDESHQT